MEKRLASLTRRLGGIKERIETDNGASKQATLVLL